MLNPLCLLWWAPYSTSDSVESSVSLVVGTHIVRHTSHVESSVSLVVGTHIVRHTSHVESSVSLVVGTI